MIGRLSGELPPEEVANGWDALHQETMLHFFQRMRERMQRDERPTVTDVTIVRGLDHTGIIRGQLLDEAVDISNELRPWYKSHR